MPFSARPRALALQKLLARMIHTGTAAGVVRHVTVFLLYIVALFLNFGLAS